MSTAVKSTEPRCPPVDGKPVGAIDRYEARVLRDVKTWSVVWRGDATSVDVENTLELVGRADCLVYAVTAEGRSCCVTPRTVKVYEALYGKA